MRHPKLMEPIAVNLQRLRVGNGLSLAALAQRAGVGKSTIFNLEHGQGNPAIDTLWSLARALDVPIGALLADSTMRDISVLRHGDAPLLTDNGRDSLRRRDRTPPHRAHGAFTSRHLVSTRAMRECELHWIEIGPNVVHRSSGHTPGVVESVVPVSGSVVIRVGDETVSLRTGDRLRFSADKDHIYETQDEAVTLISLLEYPVSPPREVGTTSDGDLV